MLAGFGVCVCGALRYANWRTKIRHSSYIIYIFFAFYEMLFWAIFVTIFLTIFLRVFLDDSEVL
jgi:hypothetical protein